MKASTSLFALFFFGSILAAAPAAAQDPLPSLDEHQVRVFTVAEGLPVSDIREIAQSDEGYLYVSTARGLVRFDGHEFAVVDLDGFSSRRVTRMETDRDGRVWVTSANNDLGVIERGLWRVLPPPPGMVRSVARLSDGTTWLTTEQGLFAVNPGSNPVYERVSDSAGDPPEHVVGIVELEDGERIVLTIHRLLRMMATGDGSQELTVLRSGLDTREGYFESNGLVDDGGLWFSLNHGVGRWAGGHYTFYPLREHGYTLPLDSFDIRAAEAGLGAGLAVAVNPGEVVPGLVDLPRYLIRSEEGTLWMSARDSIGISNLFQERDGRFVLLDLHRYLDFHDINDLYADHEGNLWLATDRGLVQLSLQRVTALTGRHGLAENFTTAVLQARNGAVWIGTWGGGVHKFVNGRLAARYTTADGLTDNRIRSLYEGPGGRIWVGTLKGLSDIGEDVRGWPDTNHVHAITTVAEGDATRIWVASGDRLLTAVMRRPGIPDSFVEFKPGYDWGNEIWALEPVGDGSIWVGSINGLFRVRGDSIHRFGAQDGLLNDDVVALHRDADGALWISTYEHGLYRYRHGRFARLTTAEGLYDNGIWSMIDDDSGGVWMSSDVGIFRVHRGTLVSVADSIELGRQPGTRLRPLVFTESEGLPSRESNRANPSAWRLDDGRILFNNISGIVVIDPDRATLAPPSPRTALTRVLVDGAEVVRDPTAARLPLGPKQLAFEYTGLSFVAPQQMRYRYRLDGFDVGWTYAGPARRVSYTGLSPGEYTFRVEAGTGDGEWGGRAASWAFTVPPFFWQTWWFRLLAMSLVVAVLAGVYRYRVAQLLAVERLRLRIASDLHDGVASNLSSIALLSEMLQHRTRPSGLERRQLERISSAASETIGSLREIIWLVDPEHDKASDLVTRMRATANDLLHGVELHFAAGEIIDRRKLEPLFVRQVFLLYKEALHNVTRHAGASRVSIEIAVDGDQFTLRIQDDGTGFADTGVNHGHGLNSMRRRAADAGGTLDIDSAPGRGTRVTFQARMA